MNEIHDCYEEGFGAGMSGCDWLATVAGRFLKGWERRGLAAGWRAGLADREQWLRDMAETDAEAASQRARERELGREVMAVAVGDDQIPY